MSSRLSSCPQSAHHALTDLRKLANQEKAKVLRRFFKTGPGEYGEGDIFLGVVVPQTRTVAQKYPDLPLSEIKKLLHSPIHEARLLALMILVQSFLKADAGGKAAIFNFYLRSTPHINNWDLVDLSAPQIVGGFLVGKDQKPLYRLARSKNLWERRIAILATFAFIRQNEFAPTLRIAKTLLRDDQDLIHKAVGWMLREVGKRNLAVEEKFLQATCRSMPRTMLRYAIERFSEAKRQRYLLGSE